MNIFHIDVMDGGPLIQVVLQSHEDTHRLILFQRDAKKAIDRVNDEDEATAAADAICGRVK